MEALVNSIPVQTLLGIALIETFAVVLFFILYSKSKNFLKKGIYTNAIINNVKTKGGITYLDVSYKDSAKFEEQTTLPLSNTKDKYNIDDEIEIIHMDSPSQNSFLAPCIPSSLNKRYKAQKVILYVTVTFACIFWCAYIFKLSL